jgi:cytochrome bd ubiquinol oxidase subunit I
MHLDQVFLSRLQFAWVVAFHIVLPAFTVGLASFIAALEGLHLKTKDSAYLQISMFWIKIFAISFGMGVVSGLVMPFQFGTNWSRFSDATSNVTAPLLGYEGLTAFFLEAGFLGVLLFGRQRVPQSVHFFAALMVATGTLISTFWILAVNSWMQTPQGFVLIDGRFFPDNWFKIVFNPSFPYRIAHTVIAFYVTTGFVVMGVGAYTILRGGYVAEGRRMVSLALGLLTVLVPLQLIVGDQHGQNTRRYQPTKLAAIEALWESKSPMPLTLFAIPDETGERNKFAIEVPYLGSIVLTHSLRGTVRGLKDYAAADRPPVAPPFFAFRIMVGMGVLMLITVALGWLLRWRGRLFTAAWYLRICQIMAGAGFIAVLAGWTTTEVGRQPWTVYGLLRTSESVSPSLTGSDVLLTLIGYMIVYLIVYPTGILLMTRLVRAGPTAISAAAAPIESGLPAQPILALPAEPKQERSAP